jgi:TetR/AcrR family transcriptional regulator, upper aerobic nicotinate degradation pathway regulator
MTVPARKPGVRERAAQATREAILRAATRVFAQRGYEGGRVEQISKAANSYDRMIYYYFGSKEGLFIAVLEEAYRRFNEAESELDTSHADPLQALQAVAGFMWSYYRRHPEFITLLNNENLHRGRHIGKSLRAAEYSTPAIAVLQAVLDRGAAAGVFRPDVSARDLYLMIAALGYFYQSNRYTLSAFLGETLAAPEAVARWEAFCRQAVLKTVAPAAAPTREERRDG